MGPFGQSMSLKSVFSGGGRVSLALIACFAVAGCGGGLTGATSGVSDRFGQLFGSGSSASSNANAQLAGTPAGAAGGISVTDNCPGIAIREGAATYQVGTKGREVANNDDLRYQGTITRNARDCSMMGGQMNARIGIQGRIVVGPAGSPPVVNVPIRIAVVQEGVQPKTIVSKLYQTSVDMAGQDSVPFSFVAEDVAFPTPSPSVIDSYVFYIGFDPDGGKTPPAKGKARRAPSPG
jgi:hypothetical protein